ncbi:hypothetical protein BDV06DRAFT_4055 [Aspergillus oleicola]
MHGWIRHYLLNTAAVFRFIYYTSLSSNVSVSRSTFWLRESCICISRFFSSFCDSCNFSISCVGSFMSILVCIVLSTYVLNNGT